MQGAVLEGGHGLQRPGAPAGQLAARGGMLPQLRILLDGLHHALLSHCSQRMQTRNSLSCGAQPPAGMGLSLPQLIREAAATGNWVVMDACE